MADGLWRRLLRRVFEGEPPPPGRHPDPENMPVRERMLRARELLITIREHLVRSGSDWQYPIAKCLRAVQRELGAHDSRDGAEYPAAEEAWEILGRLSGGMGSFSEYFDPSDPELDRSISEVYGLLHSTNRQSRRNRLRRLEAEAAQMTPNDARRAGEECGPGGGAQTRKAGRMFASMQDKSVFITGAGKGIGRGIAKVFAANGAKTFLAARSENVLAELAEEIRAQGGTAEYCAADVSDRASLGRAAGAAVSAFGGIDVLCANAGIFPSASLEAMTEDQWDGMLGTNLKGTFLTVRACLPALKKSGSGRIIVTSSITGPVTGYPGWCHYAASKAGQMGFVRTAALELAPFGITVNAIQPGNILTEGLEGQGEEYLKTMAASIPLKRLGRPEDIGNTALFLASREAGFITGQGIIVDGGQILPESLEAIL